MSDLISRQAASGCEYWDSESNFCSLYRPFAVRRGRWIIKNDVTFPHIVCSECKKPFYGNMDDVWNYCPNCGARMVEEVNPCDTCENAKYTNLEDDDSPCRDCGVDE